MSVRTFVHDVLASVARVDEPFTRPAAERPIPAWLVSLTRTSRAFAGRPSNVGDWPADLSAAVTRDTPAFGNPGSPAPRAAATPSVRRVRPRVRVPAGRGLVLALAAAVTMLVIPTAFAWSLRDSVYEPGGIAGPPLATASPPPVGVPPDSRFSPAYDTRMVVPGADHGRPRTTGIDLRQPSIRADARDLTVEARPTTTTITLGSGVAGANLLPTQRTPEDCLQAVAQAPFPAGNVLSAKQDVRFCVIVAVGNGYPDLVVDLTVEDVAGDGSISLRLVAKTIGVPFSLPNLITAPACVTLRGIGTRPADGEVAIFVRRAEGAPYFYERLVTFTRYEWTAIVVIGDPTDAGMTFVLSAVAVTASEAAALRAHDGTPYAVPTLPGTLLSEQRITRTAASGTC